MKKRKERGERGKREEREKTERENPCIEHYKVLMKSLIGNQSMFRQLVSNTYFLKSHYILGGRGDLRNYPYVRSLGGVEVKTGEVLLSTTIKFSWLSTC